MQVQKGEMFNSVKVQALPRNTFDLSHQHATTINFAELVPVCCMEAIPGDSFKISSETFIRLQPLITPMMHRCDFTVHYFFVPNRILWDGFENFITGNNLQDSVAEPVLPYYLASTLSDSSADDRCKIFNYLGCELNFGQKLTAAGFGSTRISALPTAAYSKIYYDYYIPRELAQAEGSTYEYTKLVDGDNASNVGNHLFLKKKGWRRDYFTSALPYAQKGDPVSVPGGEIPDLIVKVDQNSTAAQDYTWSTTVPAAGTAGAVGGESTNPAVGFLKMYAEGGQTVAATTINDLRRAFRLQEWLEKNARAGTRYTESLRAHFNVTSSDARLQRAEYITGVKSPIIVSEVLNNTGEVDGLPQGNMSGHGIGIADSYTESYYCEEHGWIMGILSVTPRASYATGLPRFFTKRADRMDWFWNDFANIGEQEIEQIEIQATFTGGLTPTTTFGYIPRYSEYKYRNDYVSGEFQDDSDDIATLGSLRTWVMQRKFGDWLNANLNSDFITEDIQEVASAPFAVEEMPIMVQHVNKIFASRQMPVYGTPTF